MIEEIIKQLDQEACIRIVNALQTVIGGQEAGIKDCSLLLSQKDQLHALDYWKSGLDAHKNRINKIRAIQAIFSNRGWEAFKETK